MRIGSARRRADEAGFGEPDPVEIERSREEIAEFRIVAEPVLRQHQRLSCPLGGGLGDDCNGRHQAPPSLSRKSDDQSGDLRAGIFLQEMAAGHHVRPLGMRQQALESFSEGLRVKHFVLASPDDQGRQSGLRQRRFEPDEPRPGAGLSSSGIHRGQAQVSRRVSLSGKTAS